MSLYRSIAAWFSWPRVAIAEGYALILVLREWLGLNANERFSRYFTIEILARMLAALLFLVAIGVAEEAVRRGGRRILSYGVVVVVTSLLCALIFAPLRFDMAWSTRRSLALFILQGTMQTALWASLALIVIYNSAQTSRVRRGVKEAQMKRVRIERKVLESRLDAVRKQVDGPALFQELTEIRDGLRREDPQAAEALGRLVRRLRRSQAAAPVSRIAKGAS